MKRRLQWFCSCALLCALLVTAALPAPAAAASTGFSDVPESHWAADSIRRAVDLGLFQGQTPTRFGLGAPMTRGAFVVALCRLFGWEMVTPEAGSYTDNQDKSAWYYSAVETAYANGAITRQTDTFRPREPITREELAVMLVRAMGYGTIAGLAQDLPMPFRDVTTNVGYIAMAHELGLVNGTAATTFSPDQTATREQAAVMLIRLYDSYHAAAPEKTGIAYSAEGLTDLTGYGAVAVGGARLIYAGESRLAGTPDAETAAALQETITAAGAVPLLHVGGSASALKDDPSHTAEVLAAAVESGGYEGLFLDLAELSSAQKKDFTALAEALRAELGEDRLLYLMVEAPVWQGAAYNGYDYAALSEPADKLVVRVADYGDVSEDFPIAPLAPLEEVYYALAELADQVDSDCLSLLLTTTGSAWTDGRHTGQASAAEIEQLLSASQTKDYYSDRYACAYLTSGSGESAAALQELLHPVGSQGEVGADGDGELDVVLLAKGVQPVQEILGVLVHFPADGLAQVVDEHMGDIIVARIQAADEAPEELVAVQIVLLGVDQADVVVDIVCHGAVSLDANHVAGLVLRRVVDQFNELLGLAGALHAHNQSDHSNHSCQLKSLGEIRYVKHTTRSREKQWRNEDSNFVHNGD